MRLRKVPECVCFCQNKKHEIVRRLLQENDRALEFREEQK